MNFRQLIQDYFTFSRSERKGITILLILIFLLAVANKTIFYFETPAKIDTVLLDSAKHELATIRDSVNQEISVKKLFIFDPNSIDSTALDSLNIPKKIKINLLKFRNKGGKIYSKNDFRKIYGVTEQIFIRIEPYLQIADEKSKPASEIHKTELFLFDPNKATNEDFIRLGLFEKQIATIRKYQDKGGVFHSKEDFFKMRVLTDRQKKTLSDFVSIEKTETHQTAETHQVKIMRIELNSANSTELEFLPGIGEKLSKRIVKYRNALGGFYAISQLKEVYGLSEQAIKQIEDNLTIDISKIRKIDLNFADVNDLSKHPYLKKDRAEKITGFRAKYGSIQDPGILRDSMILNIEEFQRLKPYF